jgi:hypothetical protein
MSKVERLCLPDLTPGSPYEDPGYDAFEMIVGHDLLQQLSNCVIRKSGEKTYAQLGVVGESETEISKGKQDTDRNQQSAEQLSETLINTRDSPDQFSESHNKIRDQNTAKTLFLDLKLGKILLGEPAMSTLSLESFEYLVNPPDETIGPSPNSIEASIESIESRNKETKEHIIHQTTLDYDLLRFLGGTFLDTGSYLEALEEAPLTDSVKQNELNSNGELLYLQALEINTVTGGSKDDVGCVSVEIPSTTTQQHEIDKLSLELMLTSELATTKDIKAPCFSALTPVSKRNRKKKESGAITTGKKERKGKSTRQKGDAISMKNEESSVKQRRTPTKKEKVASSTNTPSRKSEQQQQQQIENEEAKEISKHHKQQPKKVQNDDQQTSSSQSFSLSQFLGKTWLYLNLNLKFKFIQY